MIRNLLAALVMLAAMVILADVIVGVVDWPEEHYRIQREMNP